jgi:hypothetical protein
VAGGREDRLGGAGRKHQSRRCFFSNIHQAGACSNFNCNLTSLGSSWAMWLFRRGSKGPVDRKEDKRAPPDETDDDTMCAKGSFHQRLPGLQSGLCSKFTQRVASGVTDPRPQLIKTVKAGFFSTKSPAVPITVTWL